MVEEMSNHNIHEKTFDHYDKIPVQKVKEAITNATMEEAMEPSGSHYKSSHYKSRS